MNRCMEELIEWTGEWMTFFQFRIEKKKKKKRTLLKLQMKNLTKMLSEGGKSNSSFHRWNEV